MKENTVNTDLNLVQAKNVVLAGQSKRQDLSSTSWGHRVLGSVSGKQSILKRALKAAQCVHEARAARIEELRMQVEADTYQVDSTALAQKMLGISQDSHRNDRTSRDAPVGDE